jgi:hypothetical protein
MFPLCSFCNPLVGHLKDVWLAWVIFTLHAGNDPVARADNVTTFQRVDPAVKVHDIAAVVAFRLSIHLWRAVVAHDLSFGQPTSAAFTEILWVIAIFEPLRGLYDHGLFFLNFMFHRLLKIKY